MRFSIRLGVRLLLVAAIAFASAAPVLAGTIPATWTGGGDGVGYNDAGNWDTPDVPVNTVADDYLVTIGAGATVDYDVPDGGGGSNAVTQFTLAGDSTMNVQGRNLVVNDTADVAGRIVVTSGSFTAAHVSSTLSGDRARLEVNTSANPADSANITLNAGGTYFATNSALNGTNFLSANGTNASLDLSFLTTLDSFADHFGTHTRTISATAGGQIDLSGLTLLRGGSGSHGGKDTVRVVAQTGGTVDLSNLQQTDGFVHFVTDATPFSLPKLAHAGAVTYELPDNATLSLPELLTQDGGGFDITDGSTVDAPKLQALANGHVAFSSPGTLDAPMLTDFSGSVLTLTDPAQTVTTGGLSQIDNARFILSNGTTFSQITDTDYVITSAAISTATVMSATDGGTVLDASSLTTIDSFADHFGTHTRTISATAGGQIDLSGLTLLRGGSGSHGGKDTVRVVAQTGGTVDLSNLQQTDGFVHFVTDATPFSLPKLAHAGAVTYELPDNATLSLPELLTQDGGGFDITDGSTVDAPKLQALANGHVAFSSPGTLDAPMLTDFSGSVLTLTDPAQTVTTGGLSQIDNARFILSNGTTFSQITDTDYVITSAAISTATVMSATDGGTVLDASSLTTIDSFADHFGTHTRTISATNGGQIDLSGLTLLRGGSGSHGGKDTVRVVAQTGGTVDLSNLQQTDGFVHFVTDATPFSLPKLAHAGAVTYELPDNATLSLPELLTQDGGGFDITDGSTVDAPKLQALANGHVAFSSPGTLDAPMLTDFSGSVLTLTDPAQTVTTGGLSQIDNARFILSNGTTFSQITDTDYVITSAAISTATVMSATDGGTVLDASSLTTIDSFADHFGTHTRTISASNGGQIDLSAVGLIRGGSGSHGGLDSLRVVAQTGGEIDLSSLTTVEGATFFEADDGGILRFGNLAITGSTDITADGLGSTLAAEGLTLDPTAVVSVTNGARIGLGGDFQNAMTDASAFDMDTGLLEVCGAGTAWLEVAGEDLGVGGTSGNFGMMQLVIGSPTETEMVFLTDILDNDGLGQAAREALYLYGSGGLDGLEIYGGSKLVIGDIPVYAFIDGSTVELHDLFGPGEVIVEYNASTGNDGFLVIPEPATLALLGVGGLVFALRRRAGA